MAGRGRGRGRGALNFDSLKKTVGVTTPEVGIMISVKRHCETVQGQSGKVPKKLSDNVRHFGQR